MNIIGRQMDGTSQLCVHFIQLIESVIFTTHWRINTCFVIIKPLHVPKFLVTDYDTSTKVCLRKEIIRRNKKEMTRISDN